VRNLAVNNATNKKPDMRCLQGFQNFERALLQLESAVELSRQRGLSELERQGLVQVFEFTHELAWNTLKDFLEESGQSGIYGSRDATRAALAVGLIENGDLWMRMITSRNQTTHTYNEETVEDICSAIVNEYAGAFANLRRSMADLQERAT
jgi:nucleotidyltransferase substrate binding protein (TIGR01987 family)